MKEEYEAEARSLLGATLVHELPGGERLSGRIVEVELYTQDDPASHSFRGQTARNTPMFGAYGTIYIYFTYGMHYCLNMALGPAGEGHAVLIRALEPLEGIEHMRRNRGRESVRDLCNGPAKLVQALAIDPGLNGQDLFNETSPLRIEPRQTVPPVVAGRRIGIRAGAELLRRWYIAGSPYVSAIKR